MMGVNKSLDGLKDKVNADIELCNNTTMIMKEKVDLCDTTSVMLDKIKDVY